MKKLICLLLSLFCVLCLSACEKEEPQPLRVYSFHGENELFSVSNGVLVLDEEQEIFYGGELDWKDESLDAFSYFSACFYVQNGAEKVTLLHNSVHDQTGGKVNVEGDLGWISGDLPLTEEALERLPGNLFLELELQGLDRTSRSVQQQMTLREITPAAE